MKPELSKLWTDIRAGTGEQTIRADFSNDRHYEAVISHPGDAQQIAQALINMARMIGSDPALTNVADPVVANTASRELYSRFAGSGLPKSLSDDARQKLWENT